MKDLTYSPEGIADAVVPYTPRVTVSVLLVVLIPPTLIDRISVPAVVGAELLIKRVPSARPVLRDTLTLVAPDATSAMLKVRAPVVLSNARTVAVNPEVPPVIVSPATNKPIRLSTLVSVVRSFSTLTYLITVAVSLNTSRSFAVEPLVDTISAPGVASANAIPGVTFNL